jgi:hypothetical protein
VLVSLKYYERDAELLHQLAGWTATSGEYHTRLRACARTSPTTPAPTISIGDFGDFVRPLIGELE